MRLPALPPERWASLFAAANIAFLGGDIAVAHAANHFARRLEWAPIVFSALGVVLLAPGLVRPKAAVARVLDVVVAAAAILVGVVGMILHLESAFFEQQTLRSLVYAAPFIAPLAYIGVGLLILLVRLEPEGSPDFGPWVIFLAMAGFAGNFGLSLTDHAQNGFFRSTEWIPVVSAAYGAAFLFAAAVWPEPRILRACWPVLAVQAAVGVLGFVLHMVADAHRPSAAIADRFLYGAPAFAPLLFTNLALLAAIGLWATARTADARAAAVRSEGPGVLNTRAP